MAENSTSESTVAATEEKAAPAEVAATPVEEPKTAAPAEAEPPKAAADPIVAEAADMAAVTAPAPDTAVDEAATKPDEAEKPARKELPGLSGITVPSALMAAAIANRRRLAKWLDNRAAMLAIAAGAGAIAGSVISTGFGQGTSEQALRASIGELTAEVATLRARIAGKPSAPMTGGPEIADAGAVSNEITGSIKPARQVAEGWVLWRVRNGRALVQGSSGYFEVAPGSRLPKLGTVEAITRQGDHWSVKTEGGLILPGR